MTKKQCAIAILAAGKGTRLKLPVPKALAPILGETLLDFVLKPLSLLDKCNFKTGLVLGHKKAEIKEYVGSKYSDKKIIFTTQDEQNGTGHALQCFINDFPQSLEMDYILVTCADTPLLTKEVFETLFSKIDESDALVLSFIAKNPKGYGRIKKFDKGLTIIEEKDCEGQQRDIKEVNSGVYLFKTEYLKKHLKNLDNQNAAGEFYLTDLFKENEKVEAITYKDESIFLGVNDASQLEEARKILQKRKVLELQNKGVFFEAPDTVYIDDTVHIGSGSVIGPNVKIQGRVDIKENVEIEMGAILKDVEIATGTSIKAYSYLEDAKVGGNASIGPFARLRPGADLHAKTKVGNFVEVKKSVLKEGSKVSHLSYVGDAEIGKDANIGCGFITCNYDGINKHKTIIGDNCFIGSDCQMIAPIELGDNCFVAAGSTITKNMKEGDFAIARSKQVTKEDKAKQFLKKK